MASPSGQYLFTEDQRVIINSRISNNNAPLVFGGSERLVDGSNSFDANPSANRYTFIGSETPINADSCYLPVPFNSGCPNTVSTNMQLASVVAWATDNSTLAQKIIDQIVLRSNDVDLDFSNTARFRRGPFAPTDVPYFFVCAWMSKMLDAYTLLDSRNLITLTTTERNRLDDWFEDCKDWCLDVVDNNFINYWGAGWQDDTNWNINKVANTNQLEPNSDGNSTYTNPPFAVSDGNGGFVGDTDYTFTTLQVRTLAGSRFRYSNYLQRYGLAYNDAPAKQMAFDMFRMYFEFAVWSDGTVLETNRTRRSVLSISTHNYMPLIFIQLLQNCTFFRVAKLNGLAGMENNTGSEFYDFTTDRGWSSYSNLSSYAGSDTAGGSKGIKLIMDTYLKYHRQANGDGTGGWADKRYTNFTGAHTLLGLNGGSDRNFTHVYMYANAYYDNPEYEAVYKQESTNMPAKLTYGNGAQTFWAAFNSTESMHGHLFNVDMVYAETDGILAGVTQVVDDLFKGRKQNAIVLINN